GNYAFYHCTSLKELTILGVTIINGHAFNDCSDMTIYYSGDVLDYYIDDNESFWDAWNIVWVKQ
ncbi:MAG: leucine-rich repeat domain-containing protein, partial [Lachnospiraceae bacterium]|nr:leucine-rich repeat domain-containing protein [Lachnospiraceae bacterium]